MHEVNCLDLKDKKYLKYLELIKEGKNILAEVNVNPFSLDDEVYINKEDYIYYDEINNKVDFKFEKNDLLPKFINEKISSKEYLEKLSKLGLSKRLNGNISKEYNDRLNYELSIIDKMGFNDYFLVVYDYVKFAKKNNIMVGPGRGSAPSSLVSYSVGITDIDPIKNDLYFERFLNPERITMPDIDIDFDSNKKDIVISYVKEKYGHNNVAEIITYSNFKTKLVLRDVSRIFMKDNIDNFIKLFDSKLSIKENLKNKSIISMIKNDTLLSNIVKVSLKLENLKKTSSIHAAGVVISSKNLNNFIPIVNDRGRKIIGFTKDYIENLGLLKMDFLSLDNLTMISEILERN